MKSLLYCLPAILLSFSVLGQKPPIKFGDIPMEDMTMTRYGADSSASAVILCDYGEAYIMVNAYTATMNFERHMRIKILNKDGLSWADGAIPLFYSGSAEERVQGLKAVSYNLENGKVVETKMSKDGVFKEKFNKNINLQKFTIPNTKEGSVVEYSYTVVSDFVFNFPNWQFQYTIPARHSEYWAILPDFLVFEKYMQGYLSVSDYEVRSRSMASYQANAHHWTLKNVPAFKDEPYMTSERDYVSKVNFALSHITIPGTQTVEIMGSWAKLSKDLLESEAFGRTVSGSNFLKKTVEEITAGIADPMKKVEAIHRYVKENLEWDGTADFEAESLKKVFEKKKGTSGDINLALASMLEKAGIQVEMVILSTRDHGFIRQAYPMRRQFNYVVCSAVVNGKTILLDATERYLPMEVLPERCLNGQGLRISAAGPAWIDLQPKAKSRTVVSAELALDPAGSLTGQLSYNRDGYDAGRMRRDFVTKGQETYLKDFLKDKAWQVDKTEFTDIVEIGKTARQKHDLTIPEHASAAGDVIYINPFVTAQLGANPFKQSTRLYPVDFGSPIENVYMCKITLPEGYHVDELPQSKLFALPGNAAKFSFNVTQQDNFISITSNLQINKNLFLQTEYPNLREFYNQVVAKQAEQIVLKRNNN